MKFVVNLFAALLGLLAAQTASAQSNYPNHPVKILVGFTPGTAPDLAARILADRFTDVLGNAVRGREHCRRRQQHRHRSRRQGARRRLHPADGRQRGVRRQSQPVRNPAVRSGQGFCPDLAGLHRGERARRAARSAGQERGGPGGARQGAARQAFLWPCRRRHLAASGRRTVQIRWRMSNSRPCPIAAPRRSCRTCSPTASACRSPIS